MEGPFRAVAVDYDGTLTRGVRPRPEVLASLARARQRGLKMVLVTGRRLVDLRHAFAEVDQTFDAVVAENGGVLARGGVSRPLAAPVEAALEDALVRRGVPVQAGEVLLACDAVHAVAALEEAQRLGLDCQLVRNRAALMVLPAGVGKGTGVAAALAELGVSPQATVGIGDAENDHALLRACGLAVAVGNALEPLKAHADVVLDGPAGQAVAAFLDGPVLSGRQRVLPRQRPLLVGRYTDGEAAVVPSSMITVLIVGGSGRGKSATAGLLIEQLVRHGHGVLVVDQEGDHGGLSALPEVLLAGGDDPAPPPGPVMALLRRRWASMVIDLSRGVDDTYLDALLGAVADERRSSGAPHWLVVDEAHRTLQRPRAHTALRGGLGTCLITWRPGCLDAATVATVDAVVAFPCDDPDEALVRVVATVAGIEAQEAAALLDRTGLGQAVLAGPVAPRPAAVVDLAPRQTPHVRHARKYAEAALPLHLRFAFRRPDGTPTGRMAANVAQFHDAVAHSDDEVLVHHLGARDFSRWALGALQDPSLGDAFAAVEDRVRVDGEPTTAARRQLLAAVGERYLR